MVLLGTLDCDLHRDDVCVSKRVISNSTRLKCHPHSVHCCSHPAGTSSRSCGGACKPATILKSCSHADISVVHRCHHIVIRYGCMQSINVLNDIYYLKWPQVWLEHLCKDNGWTPVLDVNGSEVTFDTQAEISAVQYEGGRFVAYTSSYSFSRIFGKELLIGNALDATRTYTSFENIDPLQQNGLGVFLFLGLTAVAVSMLGYAQACADTNVKDYFVAKQKERDEAENGTFEGGGHGSGGTFNGGGGADGVIVETDFEEVGTMLKGQQAAASSRAAPSIQMRTNKSRERPLSEAFDGFDDAGGEKHLAKKKEKKPKKQETAAQRHSVTSDGQPATSGLGTFVAPNAESTTDLTASTPAGIGDW